MRAFVRDCVRMDVYVSVFECMCLFKCAYVRDWRVHVCMCLLRCLYVLMCARVCVSESVYLCVHVCIGGCFIELRDVLSVLQSHFLSSALKISHCRRKARKVKNARER